MTDIPLDSEMLTGEPFKVGSDWFRTVIEKPDFVRLTWGSTASWAEWDPLDFNIVPANEVAAAVLAAVASHAEGD
jgi:hypothetical protein